jgi:GT2 family glycosyltransferase
LKILLTNTYLASWTGSELYVRDVARALRSRGHTALLFSPVVGPLGEQMRREGFVVVDDLGRLPGPPELIHGQHHVETMAALAYFRATPAVFFCHGVAPWEEIAPRHPRIGRYVALGEAVAQRLVLRDGVPERLVTRAANFVDTGRFTVRAPLPARPRRALVFSNYATEANYLPAVRAGCAKAGISLDVIGSGSGRTTPTPEQELGAYDVIFAVGRSALEGLAVGAAVIPCNVEGVGEMVEPGNLERLRRWNIGRPVLRTPVTAEAIGAQLARYDPASAAAACALVRREASLTLAIEGVVAVYGRAIAEFSGPLSEAAERDALHRYHCWLPRAIRRRFSDPAPVATADAGGEAGLCCVVLCHRGQDGVVEAVRSLERQETPCEVVVVNSEGPSPEPLLRAAGCAAPVVHREGRLFPGAARNLGVAATTAPYVAFLAADCVAEPGWVRGRLARHREGAAMVSSVIVNADGQSTAAWASYLALFARRMPGTPPGRALHYGLSYARELLERVGPFREDLRTGEDTELNRRAASAGNPVWAPEVRTGHRHPRTLRALLREQFDRGARAARAHTRLAGRPQHRRVGLNALTRWLPMLWVGIRSTGRSAFWRPLAGATVSPVAALAYAAGAWFAGGRTAPDEGRAPAACGPAAAAASPRPPRVFALCAFRDEARFLPGLLENLEGQVDGLLALDDGSSDGGGALVAAHPLTRRLLRRPAPADGGWDEAVNQRALIEAAWETDADWLIAVDADERLEEGFRERVRREIARADVLGYRAYWVRIRELWNQGDTWRVDGIWGGKGHLRLFRNSRDHEFDTRRYHRHWGPLNARVRGRFIGADLVVYHLRMIREEDRRARQARYMRLDPDRRWQSIGYEYLTDEADLRLERLPPGRGYRPR